MTIEAAVQTSAGTVKFSGERTDSTQTWFGWFASRAQVEGVPNPVSREDEVIVDGETFKMSDRVPVSARADVQTEGAKVSLANRSEQTLQATVATRSDVRG